MLRLTGAVLIGVVCAYCGFFYADSLKRRSEFLSAFVNSLSVLETEICFGRYDLERVFKALDDKKLFGLYERCRDYIPEYGIKKAWQSSTESAAEHAMLKAGDIAAVLSLGAELGMSDIDGQKKAIARTAALASGCADNAQEEYMRLGRVYRSCGILLGMFVVLMFI